MLHRMERIKHPKAYDVPRFYFKQFLYAFAVADVTKIKTRQSFLQK